MVFDQTQPLHLFFRKLDMSGIFTECPLHEVIVHLVRKWAKGIGIAHLKADDGNQVGQLRHSATFYLVRLLDGIAIPQPFYRNSMGFQLFV